jgi:glycine/D-amino acid oxidase-like deaminating enzyme
MIFDESRPTQFHDKLPARVDVVVIGGGVIGISTAFFLAKAGYAVLVCEKGRVAGEQSSRNWGWIRQQGRDPAELSMATDSINTWEEISKDLDEDIGFARTGVLYCAKNAEQLAGFEDWLEVAQQHQLDTRMLSGNEIDALVDGKPGQWLGGIFTPSDGKAEPYKAVPALARALQRHGGLIQENCAVRGIDRQGGVVRGVITEHGRVTADSVVCAGGAWSSMLLHNLGTRLPQLTVRATVARTAAAPNIYEGAASTGTVAIRRRADGGYTVAAGNANDHYLSADSFRFFGKFLPALRQSRKYIRLRFGDGLVTRLIPQRSWSEEERSPFEMQRVLNPAPSPLALKRMRTGLKNHYPQLADLPFSQAWAGMIDVTPDVVPVMDAIPDWSGLFVATGFSGHGFGIGPGAGKVMARLVQGKDPGHDLQRFRFARFSDGSKMRPGPGL